MNYQNQCSNAMVENTVPMEVLLKSISGSLENLKNEMSKLYGRLGIVMSQPIPLEAPQIQQQIGNSPLASEANKFLNSIEQITSTVRDIHQRLEI